MEQDTETVRAEPIAIVGVGCKLPGDVSNLETLFQTLRDGRNCITEVPPDRWDVNEYYDSDQLTPGKTYVRYGGFVTGIDRFDAGFFGISDAEAARMDPQQRMALQTVWHALEDAGQSPEELFGSDTGVFLAMMNTNGYSQLKATTEGIQGVNGYDAIGDAISIAAGRISNFLGLEGPCFAVDTACSGSMVAVHLARQSILAGECDSAIVLGVSAILHPGVHIAFSKVGLMSRAGRCAAFDESADGYIRAEGCMAVLLRRQSLAIERGDRILASIVGTAVNQDGHTAALTAPNGQTQQAVMQMALSNAAITPREIGYVEAHGTGTPVGDPIEMTALATIYSDGRAADDPLFVGSAKSNFGHIESGAGLLGLVKAALSLDREMIFPSLHFKRLNPSIRLGDAPILVPTAAIPWPRGNRPRMAGINSFGYSGTNAHAVLQEAPAPAAEVSEIDLQGRDVEQVVPAGHRPPEQHVERHCELLVLSAKSGAGLRELAKQWIDLLTQDSNVPLSDLAFTAATGRSHLRHRLAVVGRTKTEVREKLRAWLEERTPVGLYAGQPMTGRKRKTVFVFTGQGAQYARMGRQLYEMEPPFKAAIDRCAAIMDADLGASLHEVLFGAPSAELLNDTRYVQPALFALEYALAELLTGWGIEPDYAIGHSVGEIAAACVAGVLDLEGAARFVMTRGRLMGSLPRNGKMLAVEAAYEQALEWIEGKESEVSIAAVNGPFSVVVSGKAETIDAIAEQATAAGRRSKQLEVSHAFHSSLMDPILEELSEAAGALHTGPARLPIVSNVTGDFYGDAVSRRYWSDHVRLPVLFHQGMRGIIEAGCSVVIEIGPQPALIPLISSGFDMTGTHYVPTLKRDRQDLAHILETLASLHVIGFPLRLDHLFAGSSYRRVSLPLYPFRPERHWLYAERPVEKPLKVKQDLHPLLGQLASAAPNRAVFETTLAASTPWVDHRILGATVFPGTAYLEMAARGFAAVDGADWRPAVLRDVSFDRPLTLVYGKPRKVKLTLEKSASGRDEFTFVISSASGANGNAASEETYCRGRVAAAGDAVERASRETELACAETRVPTGPFYGELRKEGLEYGATFSTVRELWHGKANSGEAVGRITRSPHEDDATQHPFQNTVLLDGCLHVFGGALRTLPDEYRGAFIPASIQSITLARQLPAQVWSRVSLRGNGNGRAAVAQIRVLDDAGDVLAQIDGLELFNKSSLSTPRAAASAPPAAKAAAGPVTESRDQLVARLNDIPQEERVDVVVKWLSSEVKDIMGKAAEEIDFDNIDPSMAFLEIGLDSLLVTELQRRIQEKLDFRFQPMQALDYQTIESLAEFILRDVLPSAGVRDKAQKATAQHAT
jgi:acyl transferase domain-containing protein